MSYAVVSQNDGYNHDEPVHATELTQSFISKVEIPLSVPSNSVVLADRATLSCICATIVFVAVLIVFKVPSTEASASKCYLKPSCTAKPPQLYDTATGFTNNTGWSASESGQCCQICFEETDSVVCFDDSDTACLQKTGNGDYDYLVMDYIWLPQWCTALSIGHDPTLSHLAGSICFPNATEIGLSIHGLWPNYYGGYAQCCRSDQRLIEPLDPAQVIMWDSLYDQLKSAWVDPTSSLSCSTCYLWNHEWEKHGSCFSPLDPQLYFTTALYFFESLSPQSSKVNSFSGLVVNTTDITALYPHDVNVICDPNDPDATDDLGILSEIQICWRNNDSSALDGFEMFNCPPASQSTFTKPCPTEVLVRDIFK